MIRDEAHAALDRLLDVLEWAYLTESPEEEVAARQEARRLWAALTKTVDQQGTLSEAYREAAYNAEAEARDERSAGREFKLDVAGHVLHDLCGAFRPLVGGSLAEVAGGLIDLVQGRKGTGVLEPLKRGRGKRRRSIATDYWAWPKFTRLVFYRSGLDGVKLEKSLEAFNVPFGWRTFDERKQCVPASERDAAREVGKAVRYGQSLTAEQATLKGELEGFLSDPRPILRLL